MTQYSLYPYKTNYDLEVSLYNLRVDGNPSDNLIKNKKIDVSHIEWKELVFDVKVETGNYESLFPKDEEPEIRLTTKLNCRKTYYRDSKTENFLSSEKNFTMPLKLNREDVFGKVNLDVFISRNIKSLQPNSTFAEEIGQRIVVQGEEDFYWTIIADDNETKGSDIEHVVTSFKNDEERPFLSDYSKLNYYLDLSVAGKPTIYINEDQKKFLDLWSPTGIEHENKKLKKLQKYIDRDIMHDVYVQIISHTFKQAEENQWYNEGSGEGYREKIIQTWMKKIEPNETNRENFISDLNKKPDMISQISSAVMVESKKAYNLNEIVKELM